MTDISPHSPPPHSRAYRIVVVIGGGALLAAMATDALSVVGRYLGLPFLGAIEIVEVVVAVAAMGALIVASLNNTHATVRILTGKLKGAPLDILTRVTSVLTVMVFATLSAGSAWLAFDMIGAHEETELLRIPIVPLRALVVVTCAFLAALYAMRAIKGGKNDD